MTSERQLDPDAARSRAPLSFRKSGTGPPVMLVHGGLPAELTWVRQHELEARWSLIIPSRRGFTPSPAADSQDFLVDADDLVELIAGVPGDVHLVGFSYGGLGACIAAERLPHRTASLTLIEAPIWHAAQDDEFVQQVAELADRFAASADDPQAEREFFALAGIDETKLTEEDGIRQAMELGRNLRSPREARPRFELIVEARVPVLIVSGEHNPGLERVCDALAVRLAAQRVRLPGEGHAVQRVPEFNATLEAFMTGATHDR